MRLVDEFALEAPSGPGGPGALRPGTSPLLRRREPTGKRVPGLLLDAQYECEAGYLLITSQDCPYEEANDFTLLDRSLHTLARGYLGRAYNSFTLHRHWPLGENSLALHFNTDLIVRLEVRRRLFGLGYRIDWKIVPDPASVPGAAESIAEYRAELAATRAFQSERARARA